MCTGGRHGEHGSGHRQRDQDEHDDGVDSSPDVGLFDFLAGVFIRWERLKVVIREALRPNEREGPYENHLNMVWDVRYECGHFLFILNKF